ncbi:hypothetical protein GCM10010302_18700 [Streptomyces polychromogenes]|uniref:PPE family protein n=1 Tax=Streptomyces polychromogenes TaxID=67342 RepID=A0ABP3EVV0_9ACTN
MAPTTGTTTDFEAHSHEQLLAMIASLDPEAVRTRAAQLTEAAKAITEIGESLKRHRVRGWEGEAAHSYQDWLSRAGSATLALGDYAEAGGRWLTHAAQTMVEVRANTPRYDTTAAETLRATTPHPNDPDARLLSQKAHTKLTTDHARAVQQLTKLAQSYDLSTTELNRTEPPTFPVPPGEFVPKGAGHDEFSRARGGGGHDVIPGSAGAERPMSSPCGDVSSGGSDWSSPHALSRFELPPEPVPSRREAEVNLDHVVALPGRNLHSAATLPVGPDPARPGGDSLNGLIPLISLPETGKSLTSTVGPLPVARNAAPPRESGIVGGRPSSAGYSGANIPPGAVIGAEGPQSGGGRPMSGTLGGCFGGPQGSPGGSAVGRRMAMEPGGVIGGRQGGAVSRPFTQGGSGLVRNGPVLGAVGASTAANWRGNQEGERPDYLLEDEETWQSNRHLVPPVID